MNRIRQFLPVPSKSWLQFMLLLKVSIAITLLIAALNLSSCASQNLVLTGTPLKWKDTTKIVSQEVIHKVIQQVTSLSPDQQKAIPVQVTHLRGKQNVVFLSFSQFPGLCGELGCLVVAYFAQNPHVLVWSAYASPNLPSNIPLVAQFDDQALPSFLVNQLDGNYIRQVLYTWDGSKYHPERLVINN